jgi:ABC-type nitrate/sulfonate/bicarbonate transport system permease component
MKSADPDVGNLMRTLGASRWQIFHKIQVPSSMPFLFSGTKIAIAVSVIGAVIGEWVGSSEGLGYLMIRSKPQFLTERVFAAITILSAMGVGLFILVGVVEKLAIPWWHGERRRRAFDEE